MELEIDDLDLLLLQFQWQEVEEDGMKGLLLLQGDKQPFSLETAEQIVDFCWDRIAQHCARQGFHFAKLTVKQASSSTPLVYKIPASFAPLAQHPQAATPAPDPAKPIQIHAYRLIPFFLGRRPKATANYHSFPALKLAQGQLIPFEDGFAVLVLEEALAFDSPAQFLMHRRQKHIQILGGSSPALYNLLQQRAKRSTHPLLNLPCRPSYVMSVHLLHNEAGRITPDAILTMAEPTILGIPDDPNYPVDQSAQTRTKIELNQLASEIRLLRSPTVTYYSGWSNVIAECHAGEPDLAISPLLRLEVGLQKIWYKLFLLGQGLEQKSRSEQTLSTAWIKQARQQIWTANLEYESFTTLSASGSTFLNGLREDLVATSKIEKVHRSLSQKAAVLDEIRKSF